MRSYVSCRTLALCLAVGLLACGAASAQYNADFEDPPFTGSPAGTVMTGQDGFYIPPDTTSCDYLVYTYADNALGLVDNPAGGGEQFAAATGPAGNIYARAQRDIDWGTGVWTVWYDVAALWTGETAANNVGSFSSQLYPGEATYIHLFSWVPGEEGVLWRAFYYAYNADGSVHAQPGESPGPEWDNLVLNHWYRFATTIDYDLNQIMEVSITDLTTGETATYGPTPWYLEGGQAGGVPLPTGFRLFAGGGEPGNTVAWDNLSIGPAVEPCPGDVDGDGDTDLNDLAALLTAYGSVTGDPNYNPGADFDDDGDVDLTDLAFLLSDYGCVP